MGSSRDWPISPWLANQERMDREDRERGIEPRNEEAYYAERAARAAERAAARPARGTHHEDEHRIASAQDVEEVQW